MREVPGALERHELPAGLLRHPLARRHHPHRVVGAVDHEHRARDPVAQAGELVGVFELAAQVRERQRLARRLEAPADAVLDLLRRVRLGEGLREEELEEVAVVLEPVVAVVLRPALVRLQRLVERRLHARPVHAERRGRRDEHGAVHALGVLGGEQGAPEGAGRQPDDHGAVGAGGVHHRDGVRDELGLGVGLDRIRAVRAAVPAAVEGHDASVPREVGDLRLPVARVDDRPRRQQQDGRVARAVDLVEDADAVALDVAVAVRVARAGLLARRLDDGHGSSFCRSQPSIHSSSSAWPVSMPESRSKMIPSLNVITSETSAASGMSMP